MKGITPEIIAEVRSRADIVEVVADLVVLKRTGKIFKGLCPFHSEKTPSFIVNPDRGIFKCFGCGEGGDVFAFITKTKKSNFPDAVRVLAEKLGVQLVETVEDRQSYDRRSLLMLLYQQSCEYFRRLLKDPSQGAVARDYLERRGLSEEIVEQFQLGFAPASWDGLLTYLVNANKVAPETLVEAGLVRNKADTNRHYDLFRNRLMIPICDEQGRVIAFGGRTLGDDQVKYLNSPESPIYVKGEHLFGFHLAKESIKQRDAVIVVEGYFDALTAHQFGFTQTVATLGTALTERQAKLLVRYTESKRVFMCFDADAAGEKAVERGTGTMRQVAEGVGIELRVIRVPGGKDPDECLRGSGEAGGPIAFQQAIGKAPLLIDYQLENALASVDVKSHTGRIEAARLVVPHLAGIANAVARGEYIRQWATRLGVREEELMTDVGQWRRQNYGGGAGQAAARQLRTTQSTRNSPKAGYIEAERQLLALYFTGLDDHRAALEALCEDTLIDPVHQRIKVAIEGVGKFNNIEDFQYRLMDRLGPDPEASQMLVDVLLKVEEVLRQKMPREVILKEARTRILRERILSVIGKLRAKLPVAVSEEEEQLLQSKIMQLKQLEPKVLHGAENEEHLAELRRTIDSLTLETTP